MDTLSKQKTRSDILLGYGAVILLCLLLFTLGIMSLEDQALLGWILIIGALAGVFAAVARAGHEIDQLPATAEHVHVDQSPDEQSELGASVVESRRATAVEDLGGHRYGDAADPWFGMSVHSQPDEAPEGQPSRTNSAAGCCGCLLLLAFLGTFIPLFSPITSALVAAWNAFLGSF